VAKFSVSVVFLSLSLWQNVCCNISLFCLFRASCRGKEHEHDKRYTKVIAIAGHTAALAADGPRAMTGPDRSDSIFSIVPGKNKE